MGNKKRVCLRDPMDKPHVVKCGWFEKLGNGWWPSWQERYFVLFSNGEFCYYLQDVWEDFDEPQGTIHLSGIEGLAVEPTIPGPERPGLIIKTRARDYFL